MLPRIITRKVMYKVTIKSLTDNNVTIKENNVASEDNNVKNEDNSVTSEDNDTIM